MSRLAETLQDNLPRLTGDNDLISGNLKTEPCDFIVEEIPVYLPCGDGEHFYLWIEKEGLSAEQLLIHLSKSLEVKRSDIGVAGLKDRHAITRQWISVPGHCENLIDRVPTESVRVLQTSRHQNKLKSGHLRGNKFTLMIRNVDQTMLEHAFDKREQILQLGVPNYFGTQRFGINAETLALGEQLVRGEKDPQSIPPQRRKFLTRLALSSVQSALFNLVLAERIRNGTTHRVQLGDVLQVTASGGPFVCTDPATDQTRFDRREVVTSGPIFGPKMKTATDLPGELESGMLKQFALTSADFERFKKLTAGTRRPFLLWLEDLELQVVPVGLQFRFSLPSGAYATVVMREFLEDSVPV